MHEYALAQNIVDTIGLINTTHPHWDIVSIQESIVGETIVVHRILAKEEESHQFAAVAWGIGDIEALRPDWSEFQCAEFLKKSESRLIDFLISRGWEILNDLLSEMEQGQLNADN